MPFLSPTESKSVSLCLYIMSLKFPGTLSLFIQKDLLVKRNKGILFNLVGMSIFDSSQDLCWAETQGVSTFFKSSTRFFFFFLQPILRTRRIQLQKFLNSIHCPTSGNWPMPGETLFLISASISPADLHLEHLLSLCSLETKQRLWRL